MPYQNILVAVDESETSQLALNEAIKLAKAYPQTRLKIIHIVDTFFINWNAQPIDQKELENAMNTSGQAILNKISTELTSEGIQHFETNLIAIERTDHRIDERIVEVATAWPADLIVIGTHGRRGFRHFLLGSVAEDVIRTAPVPILLVRGR